MALMVSPSLAGPLGQVKSAMLSPIFMPSLRKMVCSPIMPARSMKPVLCVRNDRDDTLGIAGATLADQGVPVTRRDGFDPELRWPGLDEIGGLIVFGGEMNA